MGGYGFCGFISYVPQGLDRFPTDSWGSGWGEVRVYRFGAERAWADKLLPGIRLGACRLSIIPWAALCETGWSRSRIYKIGVGRAWADKLLSGIRLGACRLCIIPWAALCETGWAQSRIYKIGVGRPWAEDRSQRIRLGGLSGLAGPLGGPLRKCLGPKPNL